MDHDINMAAMNIALFCRLNLNKKCAIPIRHSEMGVLIYANLAKEPVTPVTISSRFGISKPSATAILKILKEHQYIEHRPSQIDGRSYIITVTEKGRQLVETACSEYTKSIELIRAKMGNRDFTQLLELIEKANVILKENTRLNELHT